MAKITELDAAIDNLLKNYKTPEEILGENGLLKQLTKAVLQRALQTEMTHHLGHEKHGVITSTGGNARNGSSAKTIKGDFGLMPLEIYGVDVSPTLISVVTEAVTEEVKAWQNRPLDALYPIVYMDAIRVKARNNGHVVNKAVYLTIHLGKPFDQYVTLRKKLSSKAVGPVWRCALKQGRQ